MSKFGLMIVEFLKAEDGPTAVALGTSANKTFGQVAGAVGGSS